MKPNLPDWLTNPEDIARLDELAKIYSVVRKQSALPIIIGIDWGIKRDGRKRLVFGNKVIA